MTGFSSTLISSFMTGSGSCTGPGSGVGSGFCSGTTSGSVPLAGAASSSGFTSGSAFTSSAGASASSAFANEPLPAPRMMTVPLAGSSSSSSFFLVPFSMISFILICTRSESSLALASPPKAFSRSGIYSSDTFALGFISTLAPFPFRKSTNV